MEVGDVVGALEASGAGRGELVALTLGPTGGLGVATMAGSWSFRGLEASQAVQATEDALRPRWVMWSNQTAIQLVRSGVRVVAAWDIAAVHRLVFGGWAADPARVWAAADDLALATVPTAEPQDLFSSLEDAGGDPEEPVRPDGHLRPQWVAGGWHLTPRRLARWAALAIRVAARQQAQLANLGGTAAMTARCESAAELLCAEMTVDGLPMDRAAAEEIIAGFVGPRPHDQADEAASRARRDADVLRHAGAGVEVDLRSTAQVKALLSLLGLQVEDTRAWRLRAVQDRHPIVPALLAWRKAERIATTYGYLWLDKHLEADGRLRGSWTGCDGAAGRMTASGGVA